MARTLAFKRLSLRLVPLIVVGLAALVLTAPFALAGPDDAIRADWDPWGCTPPPCGCEDYPCCTCKPAEVPQCPDKYENRRFLENWRPCMCTDACDLPDWSDRWKAIRVGGPITIDVGGQIRMRWEYYDNWAFSTADPLSNAWMLGRFRAHADIHVGTHYRVFLEGIYANTWERDPSPLARGFRGLDVNQGDLLNAFVEGNWDFGNNNVGAWVGRRELQLGQERLVSPLDWSNSRRTFQGAGAWWKKGGHSVEAFYTLPVVVDDFNFDEWDEDRAFYGANYKNDTMTCYTWEAYALGLSEDATANRVDQDRYTVGGLIYGVIPNTRFDYNAEAAYQFGTVGNADISAFMASGSFGWRPCGPVWNPRIGIGADYASGDGDPLDNKANGFNQLFPLGHKYLGHADLVARRNIVAARLEASVSPMDGVEFLAWYHMFWRADTADGLYWAGGGLLRPALGNTDSDIGSEIDLMAKWKIDRHWTTFIEYAHFFPGAFIDNTPGGSESVDVVYLGVTGTF